MDNYHVIFTGNNWEVTGSNQIHYFKTKDDALSKAKEIAKKQNRSIVVHGQDGKISSVISSGFYFAKGKKLELAGIKKRLNDDEVRIAIALAMEERKRNESKYIY